MAAVWAAAAKVAAVRVVAARGEAVATGWVAVAMVAAAREAAEREESTVAGWRVLTVLAERVASMVATEAVEAAAKTE